MAGSSGPTSTLPGHITLLPIGTMCDEHSDKPAERRVQGETDSFGAEYHDLCHECAGELESHRAVEQCGTCDWCNCEATDLRFGRDYDEGLCGPVYRVCGNCVQRQIGRLEEENYDEC